MDTEALGVFHPPFDYDAWLRARRRSGVEHPEPVNLPAGYDFQADFRAAHSMIDALESQR